MCDPREVVGEFEERSVDALRRQGFTQTADGLWGDPGGEVAAAVHAAAGLFVGWIDAAWPHPATPVVWLRDVLSMAIEFSPTAATNFPTGGHFFSPLVATSFPTNRLVGLWCVR